MQAGATDGSTATRPPRACTGVRSQATNAPISSKITDRQSNSRSARNSNQSFRSCAYALTVFGDRSTPVRYAKYSSTGYTVRSSIQKTVHDSRDETGETTRVTSTLPPQALPPGRLKITTSSKQNSRPRHPVSDIKDTHPGTPDNDGVRSSQMHPMLGGEVIEGQQVVEVVGDLGDRLGV